MQVKICELIKIRRVTIMSVVFDDTKGQPGNDEGRQQQQQGSPVFAITAPKNRIPKEAEIGGAGEHIAFVDIPEVVRQEVDLNLDHVAIN
ncbi:hypothetical protein Pcinc_030313 [Petrolisthes cinctipes]|uniref:Uncharacterized protein n=1 Tax=Petrolisthes cinctipes TaxID=88211 RepID=A0AAE1K2S0_PETCI|nr:hypothetical protein Pcinc_030313 [Petrolisthes cinctipes]